MHPILRLILAVVIGTIIGMVVMMLLHFLTGLIVPLPDGVDFKRPESFREHINDFTKLHFFTASLAHGLGTLTAAFIAAKLSKNKSGAFLAIALIFLLMGISNAMNLQPPLWSIIVDLLLAYIPMAWLGMKLAGDKTLFTS